MKKLLAIWMAACSLLLTACENQAAIPVSSSHAGGYTIVVKSLADQYWVLLQAGAMAKAEELGVSVQIIAPDSESEIEQQVEIIREQIRAGVDGLAVAPSSPDAILPVLAQAEQAGVPVVAVDTDLPTCATKKSFIGTDSEQAGRESGTYAANLTGKGGKAVILRGRVGDITHDHREAGIREGLEAGGVEILAVQACDSSPEKAQTIMQKLLETYPQIDVVVATADSMAEGAQQAVEASGRDINIIGFDGTLPVLQKIDDGTAIKASIAQNPYHMGELCIQALVTLHEGGTVESRIDSGISLITPTNAWRFRADLESKVKRLFP